MLAARIQPGDPPGPALAPPRGPADAGEEEGEEEAEAALALGRLLRDFLDPTGPKIGLAGLYLPLALNAPQRRVDVSMFALELFSLASGLLIFVAQGLKGGMQDGEGPAAEACVMLADLSTFTFFICILMSFQVVILVINGLMVGSPAFVYYFTTTMSTPFLLTFLACFMLLGAEIARYLTYREPRGVWVLVGYAIALVVVLWAWSGSRLTKWSALITVNLPSWFLHSNGPTFDIDRMCHGAPAARAKHEAAIFRRRLQKVSPDIYRCLVRAEAERGVACKV